MYPGSHEALDKPAVIMAGSGETRTFRELEESSCRLARYLRSRGLQPGDCVAILAENTLIFYEVYWAAMRSGLYLTTVNRHAALEEVAYIINDSGSRAFITTSVLAAPAVATLPEIPGCPVRLMAGDAANGFESYEDALAAQDPTPPEDQPKGELMIYSSGTTGRPKGIKRPLTGKQIDAPEFAAGAQYMGHTMLRMEKSDVYLCPAPLYHSAGIFWTTGVQAFGASVVVMEKFDAEQFLAVIEREHVTHTQVVPTMMVRIMKLPEEVRSRYDVSSLKMLLHAAAPCPVDVKRQMIDWLGPVISEFYGATESVGQTWIDSDEWLAHPGSVGRSTMGPLHICDEDGTELPPGEAGLIYFQLVGPMFAYHGDSDKTAGTIHPLHPEWVALGDIGYLDDGYLYLTDRKSFTIISGGVNIYPAEIESALIMHPDVADVAVFGLPDHEMGEFVQAVVQPAAGVEPSDELAEELHRYAREHLAGFKVPRIVDFRSELPRLPTGKLYKRFLRDEYLKRGTPSR
jgi:acyl-CoA synthetase (AMP-forming)/AMP-acid ligase II